jgi:hypothetical protein
MLNLLADRSGAAKIGERQQAVRRSRGRGEGRLLVISRVQGESWQRGVLVEE